MSPKENSSPPKPTPPAPLPDGKFFRMVRKGNGWTIQCLTVTKGKATVAEIGDWDYREVTEMKIMNQITGASRG